LRLTAKQVLDAARTTQPGERLALYETICAQRGACRRDALANDPSDWTWCPDCLTVYDLYDRPVNRIPEIQ
jgi:hypothetical protein